MVIGISSYLVYHSIPEIHCAGPALERLIGVFQPLLLFSMLFLTFCRVEPGEMKFHLWQLWLLLIQGGVFAVLGIVLILFPDTSCRMGIEAAMLCMICPTATACAVVTGKLGGDVAGVLTYTFLINILGAIMIPLFVPLINPVSGAGFWSTFATILAKVFPMLILPFIVAMAVRYLMPKLHAILLNYTELSFYLWAVALTLAIAMSTRYIVKYEDSASQIAVIAASSLLACAFQFAAGRRIGARYGDPVTSGQSIGQKNTVFAIWVGYTFFNPLVSVAGGFYSIWHNCYNTWQLRRREKES